MRAFPVARCARAALVAALAVLLAPSLAVATDEDCREQAERETRDAYRELDRIRAEGEALRGELEPYLDWQAANREVDGTQRAVDSARDAVRRAEKAAEGPHATRQAENAARANRTRARQELDAAQQAQRDAISDRNQLWNDRFGDADGKRIPREEIERRAQELDERLEKLEQAEREAARRVDEAVRRPCGGEEPAPQDALPDSLSEQQDALIRGVTKGASALDAIADLIETRDCDREAFEAARARVHEALSKLAGVADAAAFAAAFGDSDSTLQSLGAQARGAINEMAAALRALEALWAERCDGQPACTVPGGGQPDPGPAPGGGGAPPGKKPEQRLGAMPLAQDLRSQLGLGGSCVGATLADQQRWIDELGARSMDLFGNRLWFTRLYPEERAALYLLHRTRLYDLATQIALWNQLLPGTGETPAGNISEAARQGTLPQWVDSQMAGDREPDSLIAHGQADTSEFREARAPFDEQTTELAKEYEVRLAAEAEARNRRQAIYQGFANMRGPPSQEMLRTLAEAEEELRRAREALDEIRPAVRANPLLLRTVDGRRLSEILADPATTAEQRRAAIDRAISDHLISLEVQFRRVRDFDTAEEVAGEVLSPALAPLNGFVASVLEQFCLGRVATSLGRLNEIYWRHHKDLELEALEEDYYFLRNSLVIAGVTLVGVILVPQIAVPILLASTGGADALLAWNEYGVRVERADVAEADLRAVEQTAGAGALVDPTAVDAARDRFEDAVFERQLSGAFVVLSAGAATLDAAAGAATLYRVVDAGGFELATQQAAWEALAKQRPGWEAFEAQVDAARAAGGRLGEEASQAGIRSVAEIPLTETRAGVGSVAPSRGPPVGGGFQDAATEAARRTEVVGPPQRFGDLPTEAVDGGAAAAPAAGGRVADADEAFDPLGDLDQLRPPGAGGVAAADEPTRVLKRRPWGDAEADANRRTMLSPPDPEDAAQAGAAAVTEIRGAPAAAELKGAQFMAGGVGGEVAIEVGRPIQAGGIGSVLEVEVVPLGATADGLPAANTGPFRVGADTAQLAPMPTDGRRMVAKFFENTSYYDDDLKRTVHPGREAVQAELDGAPWLDRAGILYPQIHAVGELSDGTPYIIKELIDVDLIAPGPLNAAQQRAIVEGRAGLARIGGVGLDIREGNGRPILVVHPDGTPEWKMFQYESDYVGSVVNPSERLSQPVTGFDPFNARFDLPEAPDFALGGDAIAIQSLFPFGTNVPEWFKSDAWVNAIIEAERRGEITFDATTKSYASGKLDIGHFREHPEFGPALAQYEKVLQGTAEPGVTVADAVAAAGGATARSVAAASDAGASAAKSAGAAANASAVRSVEEVADAAADQPAGVSPWFARFGTRVAGLAESVAPGTAAAQQALGLVRSGFRLERLVLKVNSLAGGSGGTVAPAGGGTGPYSFMTQQAPSCWTSIDEPVPVPESEGGGWMFGFYTPQPELFEGWFTDTPQVDFVERDKVEKAEVVAPSPDDPFYRSHGSWQQAYDDQWALKRIGFDGEGGAAAWSAASEGGAPVIVAVIDSGLDTFHPDLDPVNLWRNPLEIPNERDDDGNGYVDDLIGWNFVAGTNDPWDDVGHGTHVAGVIAATTGNATGIAGINPRVRIMPLKVLDRSGRGYASHVAEAVFYAVRHGAQVINLSLGERGIAATERLAVEHARRMGVLVVVAAGNAATDTAGYGPAGLPGAIAVAALGPDDRRAGFSNLGDAVSLSAPGVEILSLRAEGTDINVALGVEGYEPGSAVVGDDGRYYYTSGTSFAAPFVTGVASLLLARDATLTTDQLERMLTMSAIDVETVGWDRFTGSGRVDVTGAFAADPDWQLTARVSEVAPARREGGMVIEVLGTATGSRFASYRLELGRGEAPSAWKPVAAPGRRAVIDGMLGAIPASEITAAGTWTVRLVAVDTAGVEREARGALSIK